MAKVVYHPNWGGFTLSKAAQKALLKAGFTKKEVKDFFWGAFPRHDPKIVKVLEEVGQEDLAFIEVEDKYYIEEYDGSECVHQSHTIPWIEVK